MCTSLFDILEICAEFELNQMRNISGFKWNNNNYYTSVSPHTCNTSSYHPYKGPIYHPVKC